MDGTGPASDDAVRTAKGTGCPRPPVSLGLNAAFQGCGAQRRERTVRRSSRSSGIHHAQRPTAPREPSCATWQRPRRRLSPVLPCSSSPNSPLEQSRAGRLRVKGERLHGTARVEHPANRLRGNVVALFRWGSVSMIPSLPMERGVQHRPRTARRRAPPRGRADQRHDRGRSLQDELETADSVEGTSQGHRRASAKRDRDSVGSPGGSLVWFLRACWPELTLTGPVLRDAAPYFYRDAQSAPLEHKLCRRPRSDRQAASGNRRTDK